MKDNGEKREVATIMTKRENNSRGGRDTVVEIFFLLQFSGLYLQVIFSCTSTGHIEDSGELSKENRIHSATKADSDLPTTLATLPSLLFERFSAIPVSSQLPGRPSLHPDGLAALGSRIQIRSLSSILALPAITDAAVNTSMFNEFCYVFAGFSEV